MTGADMTTEKAIQTQSNGYVYADYAAAAPLHPKVRQKMIESMDDFANPSSIHTMGQKVESQLDDLAARAARILGTKPSCIAFTSGASESNNLALSGGKVLALASDHKSTINLPNVQTVQVLSGGVIDLDDLRSKLGAEISTFSVSQVNSETGVMQPLAEISKVLYEYNASNNQNIGLHLDSSQSHFAPLNIAKIGARSVTISAGKLYGTKGSGILAFRPGHAPKVLIHGGGQQGGLRSGTPALAQIVGAVVALELSRKHQKSRSSACRKVKTEILHRLKKSDLDFIVVGGQKRTSDHILNILLPGVESERMVLEMDKAGFEVSSGSACTAADDQGSYVLEAMGYDKIESSQALRLSFSYSMSQQMGTDIANAVIECSRKVKENSL